MSVTLWAHPRRITVELDRPAVELVLLTCPRRGVRQGAWVDSETGVVLRRVAVGSA